MSQEQTLEGNTEDMVTLNFVNENDDTDTFDVEITQTKYNMLLADAEKRGISFEEMILHALRTMIDNLESEQQAD